MPAVAQLAQAAAQSVRLPAAQSVPASTIKLGLSPGLEIFGPNLRHLEKITASKGVWAPKMDAK